jgi:hypothetical protein
VCRKARNGSETVRSTAPPEWPEWGQDWTEVAHHPKHHPVLLVVVRLEIRRNPALPFQILGRRRTGPPSRFTHFPASGIVWNVGTSTSMCMYCVYFACMWYVSFQYEHVCACITQQHMH